MRLLVTRPQPQADAWVQRLAAAGFDAAAVPLLHTEACGDVASPTATALLAAAQGVVFVSPGAATHFFEQGAGAPWPAQRWAAAPGPGTADRLQALGVPAGCIVQPAADAAQFDSESLWVQLRPRVQAGDRVLIVRGDGGRDWLADILRAHGAQVEFLQAYRRGAPRLSPAEQAQLQAALADPAAHLWLFSSGEAIGHLQTLAPGADWRAGLALATHPRIEARARALGVGQVFAARPSFEAVVAAARDIAKTP
ncbi:uroporphyrinogen-III synthase [uncultured Aquincola sp.]|uniref:uroporphyrinogen-III synthase n=1 Tax=uncultured Aquincola sp. TaxID=886556 RepID=UPI0032B14CA3